MAFCGNKSCTLKTNGARQRRPSQCAARRTPPPRLQVPQVDLKAQYAALKDEIEAALARVLESHRFILGEEGEGLERELAEVCGGPYAGGGASGSGALRVALGVRG